MMGQSVPGLDVSITKGTSGVIAFANQKTASQQTQYPCIHCGRCVEACPMLLNPSQLGLLAKTQQYERMANEFNLRDCFECGSCSFVCPSHIPLVQYFRVAKSQLKKAQAA
jgi:electron transport complex protein RnfC